MNDFANEDALVLFSGGQDSTTCLYWAKKYFHDAHTVCFFYGQRHSPEVENAQRIAEMANVSFQVLDTPIISQLAPNSLTDLSLEMDEEKPANSYPNT
ncbi:MAG: 7-cyano-7-deazaguanine synthase, partial [Dysgonamonadaceae bacterium]